ncbi:MAG TPA: hypothetical protein VJT73_01535, partial [Polyangiaceae bacterium]|nr:hypothetical protein [Polyangiaceae bacterium]
VMAGAFVVTFGLMRKKPDREVPDFASPSVLVAATSSAPLTAISQSARAPSDPPSASAPLPSAAAFARNAPVGPLGAAKPKKVASPQVASAALPFAVQTPPGAAPAKTGGVAGGLQIKTSYP